MRDDACPIHGKPDAPHEILEARIGPNQDQHSNRRLARAQRTPSRALAVPNPCSPVVRDADLSNRLVSKVDSPQKFLITRGRAHIVEQRVHFYPSHPDLSLVRGFFHPLPCFVGLTHASFRKRKVVR